MKLKELPPSLRHVAAAAVYCAALHGRDMGAACGRRVLKERACVPEKLLRQACIGRAKPEACKALEPQQLARPSQAGASSRVEHLVLPASDPATREEKQRGCRAEHGCERDVVAHAVAPLAARSQTWRGEKGGAYPPNR